MQYDESIGIFKSISTTRYNVCYKQGLIRFPSNKPMASFMKELLDGHRGSKFKKQIRIYNSLFQFTIYGGIVDNSINQTIEPYVFKL